MWIVNYMERDVYGEYLAHMKFDNYVRALRFAKVHRAKVEKITR